jgi:hypothetical protein
MGTSGGESQLSVLPSSILEELLHIIGADEKDLFCKHGLIPKARHPLWGAALVCKEWLAAVRKVTTCLSLRLSAGAECIENLRALTVHYSMLSMVTVSEDVSLMGEVFEASAPLSDRLSHLHVYVSRPAEHQGRNYRTAYHKVVPESIGSLKMLQFFSLLGCGSVVSFAERAAGLSRLESLELEGSVRLYTFLNCKDAWPALWSLRIWGQYLVLRSLRESIAGLEELHLKDCTRLGRLPPQVGQWKSLRQLSLKNCWSLKSLPAEVSGWTSFVEVDFSQCGSLIELPIGCQNWGKIEEMRLDDCTRMESLSDGARQWTCLRVLEMAFCHECGGGHR